MTTTCDRYREALETISRMSSTTKLRNVALVALTPAPADGKEIK
jgi:hypothetical protein